MSVCDDGVHEITSGAAAVGDDALRRKLIFSGRWRDPSPRRARRYRDDGVLVEEWRGEIHWRGADTPALALDRRVSLVEEGRWGGGDCREEIR